MILSRSIVRYVLVASSLVWAAVGCTEDEAAVTNPVAADQKANDGQNNEFSVGADGKVNFDAEIVYFNFDDYSLTEEGRSRISVLADFLKKNGTKKIKVQGHSDERGATEYNLALGQKRTDAVVKYLVDLGVEQGRVGAISYGEEKPADPGHDESAWAKNRRADFVITD